MFLGTSGWYPPKLVLRGWSNPWAVRRFQVESLGSLSLTLLNSFHLAFIVLTIFFLCYKDHYDASWSCCFMNILICCEKELSVWGLNSQPSRCSTTLYHTETAPYHGAKSKQTHKSLTTHKQTSWEHDNQGLTQARTNHSCFQTICSVLLVLRWLTEHTKIQTCRAQSV